jgi:hypothetical protein
MPRGPGTVIVLPRPALPADRLVRDTDGGPEFRRIAGDALRFLQSRLGLDVWMVTRIRDLGQHVLVAVPGDGAFGAGHVFDWEGSFCRRMAAGLGPRILAASAASVSPSCPRTSSMSFRSSILPRAWWRYAVKRERKGARTAVRSAGQLTATGGRRPRDR